MKKWTLFFCCTFFMSSLLFAEGFETHIPVKRTYSTPFSMRIGVLGAGTISTGLQLKDLTSPNFDNIMAEAAKKGGLNANALIGADVYAQFTIKNAHTVKLNLTADVEGRFSISKNLIKLIQGDASNIKLPEIDQAKIMEQLIANGGDPNNIDITKIVDPKQLEAIFTVLVDPAKNFVRANAFADVGALYQFSGSSYRIAARVSPFIPIIYTPIPNTSGVKVTPQAGNKLNVSMDQYWYTALSENKSVDFSKMGLDFSLTGAYTLTDWMDVGLAVKNIPILASKLDKGIKYDFSVDVDPRTKAVENKSKGGANITALPALKVSRLCKIRVGADFRPLSNDYLIISPFTAFPLGQDGSFYMDSGVKFESHFARVLGAYYALKSVDKNWQQEACLFVDSRWATALIGVSLSSDSFATMFTSANVGLKAGLGFGL